MEQQNVLERILDGSMKPTDLPLETLRKITEDFSVDRIIGEGGFGTVYKGVVGNKNVAVKRIRSSMTIDQKLFRREIESQMDVNHENVVRFLGLCSHTVETRRENPEAQGRFIYVEIRERLLCFEFVGNGSLDKYITDELRGLEWGTRYQIIKGICAGLHYLHTEKHILHMDLKPANILLDNQMVPKITDFGLSRPMELSQTMTTHYFSSPGYGAPENRFGHGNMSIKSDMYSLGAIIMELVTGQKDIPDNNNNVLRRWRHSWNKSAKETPLEYHHQVTKCIKIGKLCLNLDPHRRPSISQVMNRFVKMEGTKINPFHWEDDMLGVEPLELQFGFNKEHVLSCPVELRNDTDGSIAFKIETTSPLPYSVEPNKDIVKPRSKFSVDITLPFASIQDYKAALKYSGSNEQYSKELIVQSFKVNEGITTKDISKSMFDKHKEHNVDEIHLVVVSEEVIDSGSKQAKKQHTSSGTRPTPIKPGTVQLVMRNNKNAPLLEYKQKVMLELTAGDYTSDRQGLDLVVVLDIGASGYQHMEKMAELKIAMRFIMLKLSPIDRLSVVTFSRTATKLYPLRQMTRASKHELQGLIDRLNSFGGTSNIKDGLLAGLKVLADRKVSGARVTGIMLMSDGMEKGDATHVSVGHVPVYTFGFGGNCHAWALGTIAAKSKGGTFSQIKDIRGGGLTKAFSQCLAGLLTISVRDLDLTIAAVADKSRILKVTAGSYPQTNDGETATVSFSNLYSREVRKVIVDLLLPAIQSECDVEVLRVTYSYSSSSSAGRVQFVAPPDRLIVWRTGVEVSEEMLPELHNEELRLQTAKMIKETTTPLHRWASEDELHEARAALLEAHNMLEQPLFKAELQELIDLCETKLAYQHEGHHYGFSSRSSHGRQRFAARGDVRLFATPLMDKYLEQASKFHEDPTTQLPSVDEDAREEVADRAVIAARRDEEIRRLRLEIEE